MVSESSTKKDGVNEQDNPAQEPNKKHGRAEKAESKVLATASNKTHITWHSPEVEVGQEPSAANTSMHKGQQIQGTPEINNKAARQRPDINSDSRRKDIDASTCSSLNDAAGTNHEHQYERSRMPDETWEEAFPISSRIGHYNRLRGNADRDDPTPWDPTGEDVFPASLGGSVSPPRDVHILASGGSAGSKFSEGGGHPMWNILQNNVRGRLIPKTNAEHERAQSKVKRLRRHQKKAKKTGSAQSTQIINAMYAYRDLARQKSSLRGKNEEKSITKEEMTWQGPMIPDQGSNASLPKSTTVRLSTWHVSTTGGIPCYKDREEDTSVQEKAQKQARREQNEGAKAESSARIKQDTDAPATMHIGFGEDPKERLIAEGIEPNPGPWRETGARQAAGTHDNAVSRALTSVLRHNTEKRGISIGTDGYCALREVLNLVEFQKWSTTTEDIRRIVNNNDKRWFELQQRGTMLYIRAAQGHSITSVKDDCLLKRLGAADDDLPTNCFHGTYKKAYR